MQLKVYVASASDGYFSVKCVLMPELTACAPTIKELPEAVRTAAAAITGPAVEDFDVIIDF